MEMSEKQLISGKRSRLEIGGGGVIYVEIVFEVMRVMHQESKYRNQNRVKH